MEKTNFEDLMKKLELIANELEKGDLTLEESITKFEEGMKLSKKCNEIIENAEKKITILLQKDGEISEENFEVE
jgi:exodeoxyribonuclease VII small subunit